MTMNGLQASAAFAEHLQQNGHYETPSGSSCFRRWCATPRYYVTTFHAYWDASRIATKGQYDLKQWALSSWRIMRSAEKVGGRLVVSGLENRRAVSGPVVVISNHMSTLETCVLPCLLLPFGSIAFVIKTSLLDYPVFGRVMRTVKHIAVSRDNPREDLKQVLTEGEKMLKDGVSVVIFPQATRNAVFNPAEFNSLGVKLAARAGVPIIPLALKTDFQGNGRWIKDLGRIDPGRTIHFSFGPVIRAAGTGRAEHETVVNYICDHLVEWGGSVNAKEEKS